MPFGNSRAQGFNNPVLNVFRAGDVYIDDTGEFLYSGTPALGNPPIAWISNASTDPFGNALPTLATGIVSANVAAGEFVALLTNGILINPGTGSAANAFIIGNPDDLRLISPANTLSLTAAQLDLITNLGTPAVPSLAFNGAIQASSATNAQPHTLITDTWNNVAPPAGFTGLLRYRMRAEKNVEVQVNLNVAGTVAAGTVTLITMAAPYIPSDSQGGPCGMFLNGTPASLAAAQAIMNLRWTANTPGGAFNLQAFPGGGAGTGLTQVIFNAIYALD